VHPRRPLSRRVLARMAATAAAYACIGPGRAADDAITFGLTPVFLTSDLELLDRLKSYLEEATGRPVRLVLRRTYQEITTLLVSNQLDAAWICGYPFVVHRAQLDLLVVPLWRGRPLYQSYLIVEQSRAAAGVEELKGDIHAFSDPDSNSGFLVTRTLLAEMGARPETYFARTFFTYGHRNVIRAVASGLAGSGSVDGYVYDVVGEMEPALAGASRVLRRSEWLGFPPIAAPKSPIAPRRVAALKDALLRIGEDAKGRAVLAMLRLDGFSAEEPALFDTIAAKATFVAQAG
jgi:phosphonate transport system substrate-binding protein